MLIPTQAAAVNRLWPLRRCLLSGIDDQGRVRSVLRRQPQRKRSLGGSIPLVIAGKPKAPRGVQSLVFGETTAWRSRLTFHGNRLKGFQSLRRHYYHTDMKYKTIRLCS